MKFLRDMLDRVEPHFEEGGKFEKLYPLYEAADTFLYSPASVTRNLTHVRDALDLKRMMIMVVLALLPCVYMSMWNTGYQANAVISADSSVTAIEGWREVVFSTLGFEHDPGSWWANMVLGSLYFLPVYIVCMTVGGIVELIFCIVRKHEINEGFLVTGLLFPLTLPPTIPLWQVALGIGFGVLIGKEVFGGTGKNFLNPALTARAFLYFSYSKEITGNVWTAADGFSGATMLGALADKQDDPSYSFSKIVTEVDSGGVSWFDSFMGWTQGSMGETSTLACLIGAAILIATGIGSWRIMLGVVLGAFGVSGIFSYLPAGIAKVDSLITANMPWIEEKIGWSEGSMGWEQGVLGELLIIPCLVLAVILILTGINNRTRMTLGVLFGMLGFSGLFSGAPGEQTALLSLAPHWHLVIGGFAFGTVFMATDPVSASMTEKGKWFYGLLIGALTILIRCINPGFPEGIMLAILFGNVMAPLIDYFVIQANIKRRMARYEER